MNTLDDICKAKREHVAQRRAAVPEARLHDKISMVKPPRGFKAALEKKIQKGQFALIAEIKKASPSKGLLRADFTPAVLAAAYEAGGAACLSVLTDEPYFQGKDEYLAQARDVTTLPVLRKDFMLEPYQILESRALGADCVLLIMAALGDNQAKELEAAALSLNMDVLVEVHDEYEIHRARRLQSTLVGINNRNLKTLQVDLATSEKLAKLLPENILRVCESGIHTHDDLLRMQASGFYSFLVGESLMREEDVKLATRKLLGMDWMTG